MDLIEEELSDVGLYSEFIVNLHIYMKKKNKKRKKKESREVCIYNIKETEQGRSLFSFFLSLWKLHVCVAAQASKARE